MSPRFEQLTGLMARVFNLDESRFKIDRSTRAEAVPGWDSVLHVVLMLEIENEFGIPISPEEAAGLADTGALYDLILERCVTEQ
jgi:acyl carrier protein